jgi:transitional endoplasmic reticulum ATPase
MNNGNKEITLRVVEAKAKDVGRGIARIDPDIVETLGLVPGEMWFPSRGPGRPWPSP